MTSASAANDLIFNVQPQPDGFYCLWSCEPGSRVVGIEYRRDGDSQWSTVTPAKPGRAFISLVSADSACVLRLMWQAPDGTRRATAEVTARNRKRGMPNWLEPRRKVPFSRMLRFNAWHRFARFAARAPAAVTTLTGERVDCDDPEVPNGFYRSGNVQIVLARALAGKLEPHPTHSPQAVRRVARRLVWREEPVQAAGIAFDPSVPAERREVYRTSGTILELMPGVRSRLVKFLPRAGQLRGTAIYHEGHTGAGIDIGWDTIHWLLERGWAVWCVDLPLCGLNWADAGQTLGNHNDMVRLERPGASHPIALLVDPVRWLVDQISEQQSADEPLLMVGRSGGGLIAYLYGALDPRVSGTVSIAGGVPLSQRLEYRNTDIGDYEQFAPGFFDLVRHEDLMLAAAEAGLAIVFNQRDPDCFALPSNHPLGAYLAAEAARHGARLGFFIDSAHRRHALGSRAREWVETFVRKYEGAPAAALRLS